MGKPVEAKRMPADLVGKIDGGVLLVLPLVTVVEMNKSWGNWRPHYARHQRQKKITAAVLGSAKRLLPPLPWRVEFQRQGGNWVDDDQLATCFKYIRDTLAGEMGQNDGRKAPFVWAYAQNPYRKGDKWVEVRITGAALTKAS